MAEIEKLPIPAALYDYLLFYECADKDWIGGSNKVRVQIDGTGNLMDLINWNSTCSYDPNDSGGNTMYGVTESTWKDIRTKVEKHTGKKYSKDLNKIDKNTWFDIVSYWWNKSSCAAYCANYACAFMLFQTAWGGFEIAPCLKKLKEKADKKDYKFTTKIGYYSIADATHAFTDPFVAYDIIRRCKADYLYKISNPNSEVERHRKNYNFRCGWLTRSFVSFGDYGLFAINKVYSQLGKLDANSSIEDWIKVRNSWETNALNNGGKVDGFIKIFDWGITPESVEKITLSTYSGDSNPSGGTNTSGDSNPSGGTDQSGTVSQIDSYSDPQNSGKTTKDTINDLINTLINNSPIKNKIKKCSNLLTPDKKIDIIYKESES